jgi:hypothetical protein
MNQDSVAFGNSDHNWPNESGTSGQNGEELGEEKRDLDLVHSAAADELNLRRLSRKTNSLVGGRKGEPCRYMPGRLSTGGIRGVGSQIPVGRKRWSWGRAHLGPLKYSSSQSKTKKISRTSKSAFLWRAAVTFFAG